MRPDDSLAAHHFNAMGTTCSLFGVGISACDLLFKGEFWVIELGNRLTRFDNRSELSRLNHAGGRWTRISAELEALLREAVRAFELSAGLVNAAILPSMLAMGYTRSFAAGPTRAVEGDAHPAPPLTEVLEIRHREARLLGGAGIDLGGIAKGWMADQLCLRLGRNVLVNLGGDLRAIGPGPSGDGWPVGIASTTVMLQDHGVATSSVLQRRWGSDLHHLIDPRTGRPARSGLAEVSVVAKSSVDAEILAKTALIAGPEIAPAYCAAHADAWWLVAG